MQDVKAAIDELDRAVNQLGLVGAMINDHINGRTFDEPAFLPFWKEAEQMGAVIFIHQARPTVVLQRTNRYHLPNTIGNLADRAVLGPDWPADMRIDWPVAWVLSLKSLTQEEKEKILWRNIEKLVGL